MVLASVRDPDGRVVDLTLERWAHIVVNHPELKAYRAEVIGAVERPYARLTGQRDNESWYVVRTQAPSRWLRVVVAYEGERGLDRDCLRPAENAMSVTIGGTEFDRVSYDAEVDVLYLHVGDPGDAVDFDASSEGHALRYDELDRLVGITILNARSTLEQRGSVTITTPTGSLEASRDELAPALASRAA